MGIAITRTGQSRINNIDFTKLPFGRVFSDHMFLADFTGNQWINPRITPFENLSLSPSTAALHYGQSVFEGMKVFRSEKNDILLFRPYDNFRRMQGSASRLCMPPIPEHIFMDGLRELIKTDADWVPSGKGNSLYVRPLYFATDEVIGVKPSENYTFIIITSPAGPYYKEGLKVSIETTYSRASKSGTGYAKAAGNYGGALYPTSLAQQKGYNQVIWTDACTNTILEESGTMNLIFIIEGVLVTPSLSPSKLAGITRASVIEIAQKWGMKVEERDITVEEIISGLKNGKLQEAFGTGTAANIAPISLIGYHDENFSLDAFQPESFSMRVLNYLEEIKTGKTEDSFGWIENLKV